MGHLAPKRIHQLINQSVYLALICVGCFFIYQGDVLQRFHLKRTNFAEYEEDLTELPTIMIPPVRPRNIKFERDYNISFQALDGSPYINPTDGYQTIGNLSVHFERTRQNGYQITPEDLSTRKVLNYQLTYRFQNASWYYGSKSFS